MEIQWEKPPEAVVLRSQSNGRYVEFAIALKEAEPPEGTEGWALLPGDAPRTEKGAKATAQNIRRGKVAGFAAGEWDAVSDGEKIWVRFKGEATPAPAGNPDDPETPNGQVHESWAKKIRAWAKDNGHEVADRGVIAREIIDAYFAATGQDRPPQLRAVM